MRIKVGDFKRIVREEAQRMQHRSKQINEVDGDIGASLESLIEPVLVQLAETWNSQYDDGDPTMAHLGPREWMNQCELAAEELQMKITEAVEEIEHRLMDGEFHRGR